MRINFLGKILSKIKNVSPKKAFSLNDLSIMIATVAVVGATTVAINEIKNSSNKTESDAVKIERIYNAIGRFLVDNKKLPCPARLNVAKGSGINYGKEYKNADGSCASGNGVFKTSTDNNILYGAVPAQSLGLKSDDIEDQYGSKIVYVVHISGTQIPSVDVSAPVTTSITITENDKEISSNALFVLIAPGRNKEGAFNAKSTVQNPITTSSTSETQNVATAGTKTVTSGETTTTVVAEDVIAIDNVFVKGSKTDNKFDDKVFFKEKSEMVKDFSAEFLISCPALPLTYGSKTGFKDQIVYANFTCTGSTNKRPAKKCGDNGDWITEASCPCLVSSIPGVSQTDISVPNGEGTLKCDQADYSGSLKYNCLENGNLNILETCKKSCNFGFNNTITGVRPIKLIHGSNLVDCDVSGYKGKIVVNCNDGAIDSQIGTCNESRCNIPGSSGMKELLNIQSGSSSTNGTCETGYSGSYSYTCDDGSVSVTDKCFKNCSFSLIGAKSSPILVHGNHVIECDSGYQGSGVSLTCNDGDLLIKSNNCVRYNKCTVGLEAGMVQKEVEVSDNILNDGVCKSGFSGSYSYKCTSAGPTNVVNNCVPSTCEVGNAVGLVNKDVNRGTSGVNGECSSGFGGYYKWNCNSNGVGSVTENNCKSTCDVGGTNGMLNYVVSYGKTGDGVCNTSQGYIGTFSWSCELNQVTGLVEGKITANNCKNSCVVGSPSQGAGLVQKSVPLNTSGNDGSCNTGAGYVGSYSWSCDILGGSKITSYCKNSCDVGTATGMIKKTVSLNSTGTGDCDSAIGYTGTYSYSCSSLGVASITQNNCILRTCLVGGSTTGMNERTINAGASISNGTCQAGFVGSYSANCSFAGIVTVSNNCLPIKCPISSLSYPNLSSYSDLDYSSIQKSISCSSGNQGDVKYTCIANGLSTTGTLSITGTCTPISCTTSVAGFQSGTTINYSATPQPYYCNDPIYDNSLTALFTCSTSASSITPSTNNCTKITCTIPTSWNTIPEISSVFIGSNQSLTCKTGFSGSPTYTCSAVNRIRSNGDSVPTSPGAITQGGTPCTPITCTTSVEGFQVDTPIPYSTSSLSYYCNHPEYDNLSTTLFPACNTSKTLSPTSTCTRITCSTTSLNVTQSSIFIGNNQTLNCASGYYSSTANSITANCVAVNVIRAFDNASVPSTGALSNISGTCGRIKCNIPANSNLTIADGSQVDYTNTATNLTCKTGFTSSLGSTSPSYTCTGSSSATGTYSQTGSCVAISCTTSVAGFQSGTTINYSATPQPYYCNDPIYDNSLTASFTCSASASSITPSTNNCTKITCTIPTSWNTIPEISSVFIGSNQSLTCKTGFSGSPTYTCSAVNRIRSNGDSVPTSPGAITQGGTACTPITCSVSNGVGYTAKTNLAYSTGSGTIACDSDGYTGSVNYTCTTSGTASVQGNCTPITCTISGFGYANKIVSASGSFACDAGYAGTINYTCTGSTTATISGSCTAIKCSSTAYNGLSSSALTNLSYTGESSTGAVNCDQTGYVGTASYKCFGISNPGTFQITSPCACASGYESNPLTQACGVTQCNTSIEGFQVDTPIPYSTSSLSYYCNHPEYDNLSTTLFPACNTSKTLSPTSTCTRITCSTTSLNVTQSSIFIGNNQTLNCASGYYSSTANSITANCVAVNVIRAFDNASVPSTGALSNISGTCGRIKCNIPANSNLTIADGSQVDYTNTATNLTCKTGFTSSLGSTSPSYTCTGSSSATGTYSQTGSCVAISCTTSVAGFQSNTTINYSATPQPYYCNDPIYDNSLTASFTCSASASSITPSTNNCTKITCTIPTSWNTIPEISSVFIGSNQSLTCKTGFSGSPTYTCSAVNRIRSNGDSVPTSPGAITQGGTPCTPITCQAQEVVGVNFNLVTVNSGDVEYSYFNGNLNIDNRVFGSNDYTKINKIKFFDIYEGPISYISRNPSWTIYYTSGITSDKFATSAFASNFRDGGGWYGIRSSFSFSPNNNLSYGITPYQCNLGYSGSLSYNCSVNGSIVSPSGTCTPIQCSITNFAGINNSTTLPYASTSTPLSCNAAGYTGSVNYTCTTNGASATISGSCTPITCTSSGNGYATQNSLAYTPTAGSGVITCNSSSAYTGSANYTCQTQGAVATITKACDCAVGYVKDNNGACILTTCPVSLIGISNTSVNYGTGNLICGNGYFGTVGYSCGCGSVTSYTNAGAGDYTKNPHYGQIFASFVAPTTGKLKNLKVKISGAFNNSGYITFKSWDSSGKWTADRGFQLASLTDLTIDLTSDNITLSQGQTQSFQFTTFTTDLYFAAYVKTDNSLVYTVDFDTNSGVCSVPTLSTSGVCTPITCTVPTLNTTSDGTSVNYNTASTPLTCKAGFTGSPTYTCSGTYNPGTFVSAGTPCTANSNNSFTPNWNEFVSAPAGVYITASTNNSIGLAGPNNAPGGSWGYYLANLPTWVTKVSFNWNYYANDYGDYDRGYFFINGSWQYLANNNCTGCSSSGTITNFAINPNVTDRRFGPGVWTKDGCCGAGFLTLSNIVFQ